MQPKASFGADKNATWLLCGDKYDKIVFSYILKHVNLMVYGINHISVIKKQIV